MHPSSRPVAPAVGLALLLCLTAGGLSAQHPSADDVPRGTVRPGISDQQYGPQTDGLVRPANPTEQPTGTRQPAIGAGDDAAVNSRSRVGGREDPAQSTVEGPPIGSAMGGSGASGGSAQDAPSTMDPASRIGDPLPPGADPGAPETGTPPTVNSTGRQDGAARSSGGGQVGPKQVYAEDLQNYTVHLADAEGFGKVSRLVVNLETGRLEKLVVARGGFLGVGNTLYDIPWDQVAAVNTGTRELRVAAKKEQMQAQDVAMDRRSTTN